MDTAAHTPLESRALYGRNELSRLICPETIAIIGASATPGSFGYRSIENTRFGYSGKVYPVNPKHSEILGLKCYGSIEDVPGRIDCAVLSVSGAQVVSAVEQCAALGAGAAVIYSSGFAETGQAEGIAQQRRLTAIARESGMRILGPNCLGVMNFIDRLGLTFQPGLNALPPITGPIGVVVQSGALGFIITQGMQRGLGFSYTFAPGNSCDVDACDLINFLVEDEQTKAIACVLEGIADGKRFLEVARRALVAGKPLIVNKMGNSTLSGQTALSHTGALTGSLDAYRAAFARTGVISVEDFEGVLETAAFFSKNYVPSAKGVGVMSASGGAAVMAADKGEDVGIDLPPLSAVTSAKLREKMPDFGSSANPCDITAASLHDKTMYGHCIRAFAEDPAFGVVVVPMMTAYAPATVERAEYLCDLARTLAKPVCIVWLNEWYQGPGSEVYDASRNLSIFRSMRRCFETLKAWFDYHGRRSKLLAPPAPRITDSACQAKARALLSRNVAPCALTERASKELLAAYGIGITREKLATSPEEAVGIAAEIGYPVALKAESSDIPHKSDAGVIRLNIQTADEVRRAYSEITGAAARLSPSPGLNGVLVQEMAGKGVEVIVGVQRDAQFGPLIVCGFGGVLVEILRDTASALAPVDRDDAAAMLKSLKAYRLLSGYRGSPPADIDSVVDVICRISELAADLEQDLAELDVNPVIATSDSAIAVDALAVLSARTTQ